MTAGKLVFTFNTFYINIFFNILTFYSFYITIHDISGEAPAILEFFRNFSRWIRDSHHFLRSHNAHGNVFTKSRKMRFKCQFFVNFYT